MKQITLDLEHYRTFLTSLGNRPSRKTSPLISTQITPVRILLVARAYAHIFIYTRSLVKSFTPFTSFALLILDRFFWFLIPLPCQSSNLSRIATGRCVPSDCDGLLSVFVWTVLHIVGCRWRHVVCAR